MAISTTYWPGPMDTRSSETIRPRAARSPAGGPAMTAIVVSAIVALILAAWDS
jgi:hypothetical protein